LAYVGTRYHGWQSQTSGQTVQDHLERALKTILRHPVTTIAASRTDSGVHSDHQVVLFRTEVPFHEERWIRSLNGLLPEDIGILNIHPADNDFHPIYSAKGKVYRYRIWQGASRHPQWTPLVWTIQGQLDLDRVRQGAAGFVGIRDFTSFCALDSSAKTRTRQVYGIELVEKGPMLEIWVYGRGFLKQMVRIMVGTLVDIGRGKRSPEAVAEILSAKDRTQAGKTAPAQGLTLVRVFYEDLPAAESLLASLETF
jgi:tRNA pseudouridine38-40 synthase